MFKFSSYYLKEYADSDYLLRARSKLLLIFIHIILLLVVLIQFSMLLATWEDFLKTLVVTPVLVFGLILALIFLRKGKYFLSANITISFATVVIIAGLLREPFYNPDLAYTSYIFFIYPIIGMCVVFSNKRFLSVITAIFVITDIMLFYILKNMTGYPNYRQIIIALSDTLFSIIFLYIIAFLISSIFHKSVSISGDEAQKNLKHTNFMQNLLKNVTEKIVNGMQDISVKSKQVSQSNQDQAASIEEVTATIEEISAGVDNVASSASYQNQSVISSGIVIDDLQKNIDSMEISINDFLKTTETISEKAQSGGKSLATMEHNIEKIKERSQEMISIVSIIDDISDKINLLSLNAAIEAARAGESGRGFAVVSNEISKLADVTASSIKNIKTLIDTNEHEIETGLSGIKSTVGIILSIIDGVNSIDEKIKILSQNKEKQVRLGKLVDKQAKDLKQKSQEISSSSDEQKRAVNEIIKSISYINEISQTNSQSTEDMTADTENLLKLIEELKSSIEEYNKKEGIITTI
ncbi:MAG: hypothetical protein JXN64_09970 [Spirochaetes bacterium]|nr:hypothetical protein [Spirochaetota bacterium]